MTHFHRNASSVFGLPLVAALLSCMFLPSSVVALGKEARVAVVIGNNLGLQNEKPLQYAEHDAERFYAIMTELGGVEKERAYLVLGGNNKDVLRAVDEAKGRIHELSRLGPTAIIVYVSAHADEENLHLEGTLLPIEELRKTLSKTPATLRLVVIDACRTGASMQTKGGRKGPDISVNMHRSEKLQGDLFIRSSSSGEPAQEWSFFRGALFTHHMVAGLRGAADIDGNGRVTLAESYSYAFQKTVSSAVTAKAGPQHPSFDFKMKGFGDWTFTSPGEERSAIIIDRDIEGMVWVIDREGHVVAEVRKEASGQRVRLAVKPGWYRVIVPEGNLAQVADINLSFGKERRLAKREMVSMSLRDVVTRGDIPVVLRPFETTLQYHFNKGILDGIPWLHTVTLGLWFTAGRWTVGSALSVGGTEFDAVRDRVKHVEGHFRLALGRAFPFSSVTLTAGVFAAVTGVWQTVTTVDEEISDAPNYASRTKQNAWLPSGGVYLNLGVPVTERVWLNIDGSVGPIWVFMADEAVNLEVAANAGIGVGWRF